MNKLIEHANKEFQIAGWMDDNGNFDDEMQEMMCKHVLRLLEVFSDEEHSGSTAPYAVDLFSKLAMFEIITPLTGEDDEWQEVATGTYQNKRCSHVFKENGEVYDIQGKVFREPNGVCYTNKESRTPVTFPYIPETIYINVESSEV